MGYGVQAPNLLDSLGSWFSEFQGTTGAGHAQKIPHNVQQLIDEAENALAQGNLQQAAQYLQQAAQAAGNNSPLGQQLTQMAQALQQYAQDQGSNATQTDSAQGPYNQNGGQQVQNSGQCGQNDGTGQQSGANNQDLTQLFSVALSLISKGDSSDANDLIRYALQQLSAQYPAYSTSNNYNYV
jgi:thioredoxin-like negative regulator of GroEL